MHNSKNEHLDTFNNITRVNATVKHEKRTSPWPSHDSLDSLPSGVDMLAYTRFVGSWIQYYSLICNYLMMHRNDFPVRMVIHWMVVVLLLIVIEKPLLDYLSRPEQHHY